MLSPSITVLAATILSPRHGKICKKMTGTQNSETGIRSEAAQSVLRQTIWFADCSAVSLQDLCTAAQVRQLPRGAVLTRRGEAVTSLCIVIDGILEISATTRSGKSHILGHVQRGQLMNLIPFIDEQGAIHDSVAHTDAVLLLIGREAFHRLLAAEPALNHRLMRLLCLRSRMAYSRLTENATLSLRQRCASMLLQLSDPYGSMEADGVAISLKLSQEEMAFMVGCSRPMINRELKQLEREGAIRKTYSHLVVTDAALLRSIVEEA
ncbi:Crp/Fnr family transcriptional regulator (plasmid) [Cupriavidus basilensis]